MRPLVVPLVGALAFGLATPARALEWPDVADGVERDLSSDDVPVRLSAARRLGTLGRTRGGPLALAALEDADDDVRLADSPEGDLLEFFQSTYEAGARLANWDRAALEPSE